MGWLATALVETATVASDDRRSRNPEEIESEIHTIDETLHNIEGCILQLQGKLLARECAAHRASSVRDGPPDSQHPTPRPTPAPHGHRSATML
jgi:hypothetical protein